MDPYTYLVSKGIQTAAALLLALTVLVTGDAGRTVKVPSTRAVFARIA